MKTKREIVDIARDYLACASDEARNGLRADLESQEGDLQEIVEALKPQRPDRPETGWMLSRPFKSPRLAGKYREQPITLYVPPSYDASKAHGLL
ncbi:MAG: hypothetical protein FJ272_16845, partial [Planctomycetes bacterium]|nr:hypothetical protein [Planctomycetota bacterium]